MKVKEWNSYDKIFRKNSSARSIYCDAEKVENEERRKEWGVGGGERERVGEKGWSIFSKGGDEQLGIITLFDVQSAMKRQHSSKSGDWLSLDNKAAIFEKKNKK